MVILFFATGSAIALAAAYWLRGRGVPFPGAIFSGAVAGAYTACIEFSVLFRIVRWLR